MYSIISCTFFAVSAETAWDFIFGSIFSIVDRSGPRSSSTRCGIITLPSLARPATTIAICIGVLVRLPWPIPVSAVCGLSSLSG